MPLVRYRVKNEYGLGDSRLFEGAAAMREEEEEAPKPVLDAVAVSGLVGILRQLGDLALFAAEIFQDLHEQIVTTASRGRALMTKVQHIEDELFSVEKAVHNQKSHIHFAYTLGTSWHSTVHVNRERLRHSDLPNFMMDSYECCREPPNFFALDRFDSCGPGSGACQRRYSDPTFFKRTSSSVQSSKTQKNKKSQKKLENKKKLSISKDEGAEYSASLSRRYTSARYATPTSASPHVDADAGEEITISKENNENKEEKEEEEEDVDDNNDGSLSRSSMPMNNHIKEAEECPDVDDNYYNEYLEAQDAMGPGDAAWEVSPEIMIPKIKSRSQVNPVLEVAYPLASEQQDCSTCKDSPMEVIISAQVEDGNQTQSPHGSVSNVNASEYSGKQIVNHGGAIIETDKYVDAPNTLASGTEAESEIRISTQTRSPDSKFQNTVCEPVQFWTNGGLLGLQPSKPPEISIRVNGQQHEVGPYLVEHKSMWQESSPPLDLMKLSSCPPNGFQRSKLRLEFPSGNLQEGVEELMFPSFQLLPGSTAEPPISRSDCDDETSGQSCPYDSSDNSRSPRSESNSELWDHDEAIFPRFSKLMVDQPLNGVDSGDFPIPDSLDSSSNAPPRREKNTPFQLQPTTTATAHLMP